MKLPRPFVIGATVVALAAAGLVGHVVAPRHTTTTAPALGGARRLTASATDPATDLAAQLATAALAVQAAQSDLKNLTTTTTVPATTSTVAPNVTTTIPGCIGPALASQSQVSANRIYCGGKATTQIVLAAGDTWVNGEVTGTFVTASQRGALECAASCTLTGVSVHDVPNAFAALYTPSSVSSTVTITGGRFSGAASLGIGSSKTVVNITGAEIDHNALSTSANCGFEAGGMKFVGTVHANALNIHDNGCIGFWSDIGGTGSISNSTVTNNAHEGVFIEISQNWVVKGNTVTGNGFKTNGSTCAWFWGGGITVATSSNVEIASNTVSGNCNGITGTQQARPDSPASTLSNMYVHDNLVTMVPTGASGVVQDCGCNPYSTAANNRWRNNTYTPAVGFFGWADGARTWPQWQGFGQDLTGTFG